VNVLLLQSPVRNLEDYCTLHAAGAHATLGPEFVREALALRDHLEQRRLTGLALTFHVLTRAPEPPAWTSTLATRHFVDAPPTGPAIDRALAARDLLAAGEAALLGRALRLAGGATFDPPREDLQLIVVRLPDDRLLPPVVLPVRVIEVARKVDQACTVGAACARASDVRAFLRDVEEALRKGVLEA
jgi:hypothetical protein